jgi:RNA polymerase sigma factor (sigma-70 family)
MKKYNVANYIRYKSDLKQSMPEGKMFNEYTRDELIIKFLPLVENLARKFKTSQQMTGVLTIEDLIQIGAEALIRATDKLDYTRLNDSEDIEKTLKSFLSKRIKGAIRRRIDMNSGGIKIPEHKRNQMRKNPDDKSMVQMFFNSIFLSIDATYSDEDGNTIYHDIVDKSEPYNINILNAYLKGLMIKHLNKLEYEVLRLSYGLDCDKHSALEVADVLDIQGVSRHVRVSELKKQAVDSLVDKVDHEQVLDYL